MAMETARNRNRQLSGAGASSVLNPVNGVRDQMKRQGHKPRDHAAENVRMMREMQRRNRMMKEAEERPQEKFKMKRFQHVQSKIGHMTSPRKAAAMEDEAYEKAQADAEYGYDAEEAGGAAGGYGEVRRASAGAASARSARTGAGGAAGAAGGAETKRFLRRGSGKMASKVTKLPDSSIAPFHRQEASRKPSVPKANQVAHLAPRSNQDFIRHNAVKAIHAKPVPEPSTQSTAAPSYGKVPKYLQRRKAEEAAQQEYARTHARDPECPPGMALMPESERTETLAVLQDSLSNVKAQLQRLPLRIETPGQIRRKNDLEGKLKEIQDAIKIFSRPKVFIQED